MGDIDVITNIACEISAQKFAIFNDNLDIHVIPNRSCQFQNNNPPKLKKKTIKS